MVSRQRVALLLYIVLDLLARLVCYAAVGIVATLLVLAVISHA